jgi:transposase
MKLTIPAQATCVALMQAGHTWADAVATAGLPLRRSAAYALLQRMHHAGDAALEDRRCGHIHKLRLPIQAWVLVRCQTEPYIPSHHLQDQIASQFGVTISISHLNALRAAHGVSYVAPKKTPR